MGIKSIRVGEKHTMKSGCVAEITEYFGSNNITIQFEDGTTLYKRFYQALLKKEVKNPNHPSLYGVGYDGQGKYHPKTHPKIHSRWISVFQRCYGESYKNRYLAYKDCTISKEWYNFQNFAEWFESNYNPNTMQGWQLDKDILVRGNKIYSPETCCFVPKEINAGITSTKNKVGIKGVYSYNKNKYVAILNGRIVGQAQSIEETSKLYKDAKEKHIKNLAEKWKPKISEKVYQALINYKVEITD